MKRFLLLVPVVCSFLASYSQELQLVVPLGHSRRVTAIEASFDRSVLATTDGSSQVKLWDYASGKELYQLSGHGAAVSSVSFHPKKPMLLTTSIDGTLRLWNQKGVLQRTIRADEDLITIARFSPTGDSLFAIGNSEKVKIWNTRSGELINAIDTKTKDLTVMQSAANRLFLGTSTGALLALNLINGKMEKPMAISGNKIVHLSYSQEGNMLVASTDGGELISISLPDYQTKSIKAFDIRNHQAVVLNDVIYTCGRDTKSNLKMFNTSDLSVSSTKIPLDEEQENESFKFGLRVLCRSSDTTFLLADYNQHIREWNTKSLKWEERTFKGEAAPVYGLAVSQDQTQLAIASGHEVLKVLDLTGTLSDRLFNGSKGGNRSVDFHPVNPVLASYGMDEQISIINTLSGSEIFNLRASGAYSTTPVSFDPTGRYILRKSSEKNFDLYDFKNQIFKKLKVKDGSDYEFSADGRRLIFEIKDGLAVYDPIKLEEVSIVNIPGVKDFTISRSGELAALSADNQTVAVYNSKYIRTRDLHLKPEASADKIVWSPKQDFLVGIRNTQKKGEKEADFKIKIIDPTNGNLIAALPGHAGFVTSLSFVRDHILLTASVDGLIKLWTLSGKQNYHLGSIIPLEGQEFVVTTPQGHFDATPSAMKELHYVKNGQIIALDQLKSEYYEPKLLSKILGYNAEPIKSVASLSNLGLHPEVSIRHPLNNNGKLGINLDNHGGGIGRVMIFINGKEVSSDVRNIVTLPNQPTLEIDYDITDHPFLYNDRVNKITVKAFNNDGTLSSNEKSIYVFGEEKTMEKPRLFAIIAGVSDYQGDHLDLKYAAKDATDFAAAISLSGSQYFGVENTHVTLLTTDQDSCFWPTKDHIRQAFEKYSRQATAKDLLIVYLSGHGVNHGGEKGDFYYLTTDADNGNMSNTIVREHAAISSNEFTEYFKSVPALKQVLIIDACHSGRMASSLAGSRSAMSSTQIRSLERMKDRTGLFVLAGSAADAVSYETTLFGQGLLTYSLLFGMKGAALRDNEFIDVIQLFQFAANKVPELAEEIGGIQKPEIRLPEEGRSFDIGRLTIEDQEKIKIKSPRPVFVHSRFQDESAIFDRLRVSESLDNQLLELSKEKDAKIVFVDDKSFSGASTIHGRYFESEGLLRARIMVESQNKAIKTYEFEAVNTHLLTNQIVSEVLKLAEQTSQE